MELDTLYTSHFTLYLEGSRRLLLSHVSVLVETVLSLSMLLKLHTKVHVLQHDRLVRGLPCLVPPAARAKTRDWPRDTHDFARATNTGRIQSVLIITSIYDMCRTEHTEIFEVVSSTVISGVGGWKLTYQTILKRKPGIPVRFGRVSSHLTDRGTVRKGTNLQIIPVVTCAYTRTSAGMPFRTQFWQFPSFSRLRYFGPIVNMDCSSSQVIETYNGVL